MLGDPHDVSNARPLLENFQDLTVPEQSLEMSLRHSLYETYKGVHNKLYSVKTVTDFQNTGRLTPKEFVEAGDELSQKAPVWQWVAGPPTVQDYLPQDKKCLVFRRAPCSERAPVDSEAVNDDLTDENGFVLTEVASPHPTVHLSDEVLLTWDDENEASDDEDTVRVPPESGSANRRLYDVYIVYDKYYETPRMYLVGYSGDHAVPLTTDQMKEDVYHSNFGKTVTIDAHPVFDIPCISIHPCRHAETMRRLMEQMRIKHENTGNSLEPFRFPTHLALSLFLKFISSAVPTIEYDISAAFDM